MKRELAVFDVFLGVAQGFLDVLNVFSTIPRLRRIEVLNFGV